MTLDAASLRDAGRVDAMQRAIGLFGTVAKKVFNERGRRRSSVAARGDDDDEDEDFDDKDDDDPATVTTRTTGARANTPVMTTTMVTTTTTKRARANASDETVVLRDVENTAPSRRRAVGEDADEDEYEDEDAARTVGATTMMRARNGSPSGKRKRGASGMPVKSLISKTSTPRAGERRPRRRGIERRRRRRRRRAGEDDLSRGRRERAWRRRRSGRG